ncbi:hypothetical protein FOL47_002920 [Perkinsus chesapeaki]|uniref:Uncharacterized protein n=1 Tax=Perkinsus chesapeaki TaxID=330153 RepID=A0A7J6MBT7_PERCH|nr:hypothetical protein FOL47_002920 [Perkinsus chesapeaki]
MSPSRIISALLLAFMMVYALGDFPQGKYIGGEVPPKPYLRIEGDFQKSGKVHLSVACGPQRANWDAWFDLVNAGVPRMFRLKDYQTDPKYAKYMSFFTQNCGRGRAYNGDLTVFIVTNAGISVTVKGTSITLYESNTLIK